MLDTLCVGDINQDIITTPIKSYPKRNEQIIIPGFKYYLGGSSAICAASLASLGQKAGFLGVIGSDLYGQRLINQLKSFKVKSYLRISKKNTDTTFAITFNNGDRSFITAHGTNDELKFNDVKIEILKKYRHLHVSGYWHLKSLRPKIGDLLIMAKKLGLSTSFDIGSTIEECNWNSVYEVLSDVDILFLNNYELKLLTKKSSLIDGIKKIMPYIKVLALHLGWRGAMACTNDERVRMNSFDVKVINPTGAGDTFNAGFLYAYLNGESLKNQVEYALANACSYISRSEQRFPTITEVKKFLKD